LNVLPDRSPALNTDPAFRVTCDREKVVLAATRCPPLLTVRVLPP
jgi:hypothetical protein